MARLSAVAFINDPIEAYLYPGRRNYPEAFVNAQEALLRQSFDRPCGSAVVVVLESGDEGWKDGHDIVGFCVFTRETRGKRRKGPRKGMSLASTCQYDLKLIFQAKDLSADIKKAVGGSDPVVSLMESNHPMVDVANSTAFLEADGKDDSRVWTEEGFKKPKERYELCDLGVSPHFRRMGIGKMMVKWVMDKALEEGVPVHSTASPAGKSLYQSMDFRTVGKWKWCPEPNSEWDVMHWNPAPQEQESHNNDGRGSGR
ncbi:hypothetical protein DBV05_g11159 [Lasiodiplodia theobromae]|uniref:N-acetyltransferase domain-containing protein n=1 Tax=Lasiodiplodia theobromae TaxID=45133 RepID=A0A5N5CXT6_9PEZI|nr:hypothetical protein DBV05_g11159 [Lasiodiplodia theobromae]